VSGGTTGEAPRLGKRSVTYLKEIEKRGRSVYAKRRVDWQGKNCESEADRRKRALFVSGGSAGKGEEKNIIDLSPKGARRKDVTL